MRGNHSASREKEKREAKRRPGCVSYCGDSKSSGSLRYAVRDDEPQLDEIFVAIDDLAEILENDLGEE